MTGDREAKKIEAQRLWTEERLSFAAIARQLGVSVRTIERWSSAGSWAELATSKVVSISSAAPRLEPEPEPEREAIRKIDELEIVDEVLTKLTKAVHMPKSLPYLPAQAGAIVKLLELRLKLQPKTAAALAEQAIALGIRPNDFLAELNRQWQQRA